MRLLFGITEAPVQSGSGIQTCWGRTAPLTYLLSLLSLCHFEGFDFSGCLLGKNKQISVNNDSSILIRRSPAYFKTISTLKPHQIDGCKHD